MFDSELDTDMLANLMSTRALYCWVDKDFKVIRYKDGKAESIGVDFQADRYQTSAMFAVDKANMDELEEHYLIQITGEKMFRNYFFSTDEEYMDEYHYFIFQPIIVELEKNTNYSYQIYPVIKLVNKEVALVDFNYYPNGEIENIEDFASNMLRSTDKIKDVKVPHTYTLALGLEIKKEGAERLDFEANETIIFSHEELHVDYLLELAELFLSFLFKYDKHSFCARSMVSLDNLELTDKEIQLVVNGFKYSDDNSPYNFELLNLSECSSSRLFIFGNMTLTLGNIMEAHMPAAIFDEELSILNTKIYAYSKMKKESSIKELLEAKRELHLLKLQIKYKYSGYHIVRKVMDYAVDNLFGINEKINLINSVVEISMQQNTFDESKRSNWFHIVIAIVSTILSSSVAFNYVFVPIYEIRFDQKMSPICALANFGIALAIFGAIMLLLLYFMILRKRRSHK